MSRSYRKPYASFVCGSNSARWDKTQAARAVRRTQNQAIKKVLSSGDWDEFLIPDRYECSHNDVWDWSRDGKQVYMAKDSQYNNPFAYVNYGDFEFAVNCMLERQKHTDNWIARLSRK
ncbi:MAG TPA: hypothetical protein VFA52_04080 [Candidatus Paceibacterota bacterium]|jgi:hypothetical protein|nr:hypothetical protein [Candidatus Paceibacterota bacterium]